MERFEVMEALHSLSNGGDGLRINCDNLFTFIFNALKEQSLSLMP